MERLIILLAFFLLTSCTKNEFNNLLVQNSIPLELNSNFKMKSYSAEPLIITGEDLATGEIIKIIGKEVSTKEEALTQAQKSILLIASQFEFTIAPYPGQITAATNCGTKHKPQIITANTFNLIKTYANERLALSICDGDTFKFVNHTGFFYDPKSKKFLSIDYYGLKDDSSKFFNKEHFSKMENLNIDSFRGMIK